jgi:hypothetical protein
VTGLEIISLRPIGTQATTIRASSGSSRQTPSDRMTKSAGSKTWPLQNQTPLDRPEVAPAPSARELGLGGRSDRFQYEYCLRYNYALETLDLDIDFDNDKVYPFTFGRMPGIIMIKASSDDVSRIIDILSRALSFVTYLPLPRVFLAETKFVAGATG